MYESINIPPKYRYERKFTAASTDRAFLLQNIRRHPSFFTPIFQPRQINNIYLDTNDLQFYKDNKIGIAKRKKIRIRWYGETFGRVQKPQLEYKMKSGLLGDKWTFELPPFEINSGFDTSDLEDYLHKTNLPAPILADLQVLSPSLLNTYKRSYFLSANGHYRLTFDEHMRYYGFYAGQNHFMKKQEDLRDFIIELKYTPDHDDLADGIARKLATRLDKSSKYVNGINYTRK